MFSISKVSVSGDADLDFSLPSREAYEIGIQNLSQDVSYDAAKMIQDFTIAVDQYRARFETDYMEYITKNSLLRKMKASLAPSQDIRANEIAISNAELSKNKKSLEKFIRTMDAGHSLLLQMREILTGQKIRTKFIIRYEGKFYEVYEDEIEDATQLTISRYGGKTVSNPFSAAYSLDAKVLKAKDILNKEHMLQDVQNRNLFDVIYPLKRPYLDEKGASYDPPRVYKNVFFDSKDAEIVEYVKQRIEADGKLAISDLINQQKYKEYRKQFGGGGGYASPFYKVGDVGSIQVKFFNFKNGALVSTVNFARFSLLRDQFAELQRILARTTYQEIMQGLSEFFTEKENLVTEEMSKIFLEESRKAIKQWLTPS